MTKYEIRVTQVCKDYYRVNANSPKEAEAILWDALRSGNKELVELNDTNDNPPEIDYTVQVSPEGEVII
tara:strand:- start:518 stop:724 length:207 start_codon:yes stop_codon:yes gene_type:complete